MARTIKMADMSDLIAIEVFQMLNGKEKIKILMGYCSYRFVIATDVEPNDLVYPEGWYYAKGCFRNKHMSSDGMYWEVPMIKSDGTPWSRIARYCTLYED